MSYIALGIFTYKYFTMIPKHFQKVNKTFWNCFKLFIYFWAFFLFSTYDEVEKNKKCTKRRRIRKSLVEKPSLMTIKLSLMVKNKKYFSMVISYSSTFEYFLSSSPLMHKWRKEGEKKFVEKPSLMTIELSLVVKKICLASICTNCFSYDVQKYIIKHANSTNKGLRKTISY